MKYSELLIEFNKDVYIKDGKLQETEEFRNAVPHRRALLDRFTGVFVNGDIEIGIKAISKIKNGQNYFSVEFPLVVVERLAEKKGQHTHKIVTEPSDEQTEALRDLSQILVEIVQGDLDIETILAKYNFQPSFPQD